MKKTFLLRIEAKDLNKIKKYAKKNGWSANTYFIAAAKYVLMEYSK